MAEKKFSKEEFQDKLDQNAFIEQEAFHLKKYLENNLFVSRKFHQYSNQFKPYQPNDQNFRGQSSSRRPFQPSDRRNPDHRGQSFSTDSSIHQCPVCKCEHFYMSGKSCTYLSTCPQFEDMSYNDQGILIRRLDYCFVCLRNKNEPSHANPCKHTESYCIFCPAPTNQSHRSRYFRNRPDDYYEGPCYGSRGGKGGGNGNNGKGGAGNSGGRGRHSRGRQQCGSPNNRYHHSSNSSQGFKVGGLLILSSEVSKIGWHLFNQILLFLSLITLITLKIWIINFCQTPVLGLGLGVDFVFPCHK